MSRPLDSDAPDGLDGAILVTRRGTRRWRAVLVARGTPPESPTYHLRPAGADVYLTGGGAARSLVRTYQELWLRGWRRVA